jgi:hypothetical protein
MRIILAALCVSICLGPVAAGAQEARPPEPALVRTTPFPDVPRDHWAFDAVEQMRKLGILRGYPPAPKPAAKPQAAPKRRPRRSV